MNEVTLSSKNQVVIPRDVRRTLNLKTGDKLLFVLRGDTVILLRKPKNYTAATKGMAEGTYSPRYLQEERESWR